MAADGHLNFDTKINTKGFDKDADKLTNSLGKVKGALKGIAVAAAAAFSIQKIAAFIKESKEAYNVQLEAETKLAQVLKNTTGATEEQVDAIKDWASELQKVGIIGDEITLSGLQELGTYIENADSLKTLSVVLDDMLAQQYGFNASAESAVTISTMLGKVLEGQTGALSRYGYKFTEAQEQILKYGTEEQRVATLAEVVEASVGGMNQALANTPTGRMKQLENTMGDIKEQFGQAATNIQTIFLPVLQNLSNMLARAAQLALQLSQTLADVLGIELSNTTAVADSIISSVANQEDLTDAVEATAKAERKSLAGFDKINKLSSSSADNAAGAGSTSSAVIPTTAKVGVDTNGANKKLQEFINTAKTVIGQLGGWITSNFSPTFEGIWAGLVLETQELFGTMQGIFSDIMSLGPPLLAYFQGDFTTFLITTFEVWGQIVIGLYDTFNTVFADIWNIAVFPMLQSFIELGLPVITQFCTEVVKSFGVLFNEVKSIFDMLWKDAAKPVLERIATIWKDLMKLISDWWKKWGAPIFEGFRNAITNCGDTLRNIWNTIFKPIFDKICDVFDTLWNDHIKPFIRNFLDFVGTMVDGAIKIYNQFILPLVNAFTDVFGPPIVKVFRWILDVVGSVIGNIIDFLNSIVTVLKGIVNFVVGVFTGDWQQAWDGIKQIFEGIWNAFVDIVKVPLNLVIGLINGLLGAVESMANFIVDCLNTISVQVPDWVPVIGGSTFGFNLSHVDIPDVPYLAQGTVVPANYGNFLAMLGDNKREPEVVSPISSIEKALENVLARKNMRGTETIHVHVDLDGREIGRVAVKAVNEDKTRKGA